MVSEIIVSSNQRVTAAIADTFSRKHISIKLHYKKKQQLRATAAIRCSSSMLTTLTLFCGLSGNSLVFTAWSFAGNILRNTWVACSNVKTWKVGQRSCAKLGWYYLLLRLCSILGWSKRICKSSSPISHGHQILRCKHALQIRHTCHTTSAACRRRSMIHL